MLVRDGWEIPEIDFACPWNMRPPEGPGTRLARVLKRLGFKDCEGCQCKSMQAKMDAWGTKCEDHAEEILSVIRDAASRAKCNPMRIPFIEPWVRRLLARVLRRKPERKKT